MDMAQQKLFLKISYREVIAVQIAWRKVRTAQENAPPNRRVL